MPARFGWLAARSRIAALRERWATPERVAAYRSVAIWWGLSRAIVFGTTLVMQAVQWPRPSWYPSLLDHPFALLNAWDGRWYRMVAERGYLEIPNRQNDTAFFPLYPAMMRALNQLGIPLDAAALIIANVGFLVGLLALYELARTWLPQDAAVRTVVLAAVFPAGYVFSMAYPQGVVLAAMAAAGVLAVSGRWAASAVAAAVAALGRPEGVFLVLPLLAVLVHQWPTLADAARRRALVAVAAAPAAVAGLSFYHWRMFGDPFVFSTSQRAWGRWVSVDGVQRAFEELARAPGTQNAWLFRDAAFCALYLVLLALARRAGVPRSWVVAGALIVVMPLASGSFTSDARFGLLALPMYAGLGAVTHRAWANRLVLGASLALLVAASATILLRWP